ncbi:MAG: SHOCT domain-containing protein [Halobacteriales archaeon]
MRHAISGRGIEPGAVVAAAVVLVAVLTVRPAVEVPVVVGAVAVFGVWSLLGRRRGDDSPDAAGTRDEAAALETLKKQYAAGEIDETEFERRVEALLANETVTTAEGTAAGRSTAPGPTADRASQERRRQASGPDASDPAEPKRRTRDGHHARRRPGCRHPRGGRHGRR